MTLIVEVVESNVTARRFRESIGYLLYGKMVRVRSLRIHVSIAHFFAP